MEVILLVIGIIILINIVGLLLRGVGAIFRWIRGHILATICLVFIAPSVITAVMLITSGQAEAEEIVDEYLFPSLSIILFIALIGLVLRLFMRARVAFWLNQTVFGEAEKFPGGERSLEKELQAGTIRRIEYVYVVSVPFLTKYYGKYKALLDSQGAATPKQFSEICAHNPAKLKSSEPLMKAVLYNMVSNGDAKDVALDVEEASANGTGYPLFISEHPVMNSNFKRREISLD